VPWPTDVAHLDVEAIGPHQTGQHRGEIGIRTHDEHPAAVRDVVDTDHRQIPQRAGHWTAAELQHHNVGCGQRGSL
jgi:hypothetical protein